MAANWDRARYSKPHSSEQSWNTLTGHETSGGCPCYDSSTRAPCIPKHTGFGYNPNFFSCLFPCAFCCLPDSEPTRYEKFEEQSSYHGVTLTEEEQFYATDYELYYDRETNTVVDTTTRWSQSETESSAGPKRAGSVKVKRLDNTTESSTTDYVSLQPQAQPMVSTAPAGTGAVVGTPAIAEEDPAAAVVGGGGGWGQADESNTDFVGLTDPPLPDEVVGGLGGGGWSDAGGAGGGDGTALGADGGGSWGEPDPAASEYFPTLADVQSHPESAGAVGTDLPDPMFNETVPIGEGSRRNSYYPPDLGAQADDDDDDDDDIEPGAASWDDVEKSVYHSMEEAR